MGLRSPSWPRLGWDTLPWLCPQNLAASPPPLVARKARGCREVAARVVRCAFFQRFRLPVDSRQRFGGELFKGEGEEEGCMEKQKTKKKKKEKKKEKKQKAFAVTLRTQTPPRLAGSAACCTQPGV